MTEHFADRLMEAIRRKGSRLCVGLDPRLDLLPPDLPGSASDPVKRVESFCLNLCLGTEPYAVAVKPQAAYFEALGAEGMVCLERVMCFARELGLLVILDAKRNDIGSTAQAYADAYLGPRPEGGGPCLHRADAITINAYLGYDGVEPFVNKAHEHGTGLFILVKTSNPGSGQLQDLRLESGLTVYQHMGDLVAQWGQDLVGASGYSSVGAVVGATYPEQIQELRARLPQTPFLVPGYGHQGASAADVAAGFDKQGLGAIVNSARGIIYAYRKREGSFTQAAAEAAQEARDELNAAAQ
ncbi:MAG: orotidine-5'-phosphate decarboxylase [Armatimonadetes bacterium]|nr:orotidine-5'-phosphate decarboxylase [Armatimonadota bacterium]